MGVDDAETFVKNTIAQGGKYIKVVADLPQIMGGGIMGQTVLEEIVRCAHENGLKVAVHAISVAGVQMATDAGVDMLIHIPIGETFPQELRLWCNGRNTCTTLFLLGRFVASLCSRKQIEACTLSPCIFMGKQTADVED